MKAKKIFLFITVVILVGVGVYLGQKYYVKFQKAKQERLFYEGRNAAWQRLQRDLQTQISQFKGEVGIVIKDMETDWEFSYEKTRLFPSASLAKIPLMAACFLAVEQGQIKLNRHIKLKAADKLSGSGLLKEMPAGTTFSIERLIGLMIYESDNTATHIITHLMGIDYLNKMFESFGLKNTRLSRRIADYHLRNKGVENYTTAEDMALLLDKIYHRKLGDKLVSDRCISLLKLTRINDRIPKYLPVEITVAHKTGLEHGICHDAGIVFSRNGDFIIVVLTKHTDANSAAAKEFIAKISLCTYNYFVQLKK
ncbi:MAG: class A beta-lactamase-related serine hydrolase [Candidatus Omnitrophica bacterium]|nr:class A beta-lactamase-related serine hydrolase [Candidatus Omnitrophota bacterium]